MSTKILLIVVGLAVFVSTAIDAFASDHDAYEGRVALVWKLDEPDGFCLDIPGPPSNLMLDLPAVVHTCKPGDFRDMIFRFNGESSSTIKSVLPNPALCLQADEIAEGSLLHYVECNEESDQQLYKYIENGQILLTATADHKSTLCLSARTAKPTRIGDPQNLDDPHGHSIIVNLESSHVIRPLVLRDCGSTPLEVSQWEAYEERDLRKFN